MDSPEARTEETQMTDQIVYYGPYACENCYPNAEGQPVPAVMICKAAREQGGAEFDYPQEPIYPNTVWQPHVHRAFPPSDPSHVG